MSDAVDKIAPREAVGPAWQRYFGIARVDHWVKNAFMLPGTLLALLFVRPSGSLLLWHAALGLLALCLCASANYTINEFLDAESDRFHPVKRHRPAAQRLLDARLVMAQYVLLAAFGLAAALQVGHSFAVTSGVLLGMGILYNARPARTKDTPYLDVLSESINNPLRLLLGWFALVNDVLPPSSIMLSYWMGGAFLMAVKRFSELRGIADPDRAGLYRRSFRFYTEDSLLVSAFFYAICSAFFLGVFLIKYRIEFLLTFPLFSLMFAWYLAIGLKPHSAAEAPERLFSERRFIAFVAVLCAIAGVLFYVDIPGLHVLVEPITVH
jgi:decaprenyl-phosphate phosphoribosyltransferase